MRQRLLVGGIYGLSIAIGILAFLYPFFSTPAQQGTRTAAGHINDAPLLLTTLIAICFVALLVEVQGQAVSAKFVALLGVLVSINSVLRFFEVAIPGPGGFSLIFFLIVLTGYVFGGRFGFLMGALTLVVSALVTGGVGPWLPGQMFAAGWIGLSAPLCRPLVRTFGWEDARGEIIVLAMFSAFWGLIYGAIMNLWFWPFVAGPEQQYWAPGVGLMETLRRYIVFYTVTSFWWDIMRAAGLVALILLFGRPTVRTLRRFYRRFAFEYEPAQSSSNGGMPA